MAGTDRSWSVAPTLLWFAAAAGALLCGLDGGLSALADRFSGRRGADAPVIAGPTFTARPVEVAEAEPAAAVAAARIVPPPGADRSKILELEDVCVDGTPANCKRWAMDGYYRAVGAAKAGTLGRALRVSWYGDSVVATDAIPGRLRALLQGELGDGGPGFVYVVPPHRFCGHEAITRVSGGSWLARAISTGLVPDGMYGLGASTAESNDGRAAIRLNAGTASRVELYYLAQPHGGTVALTADGKSVATIETSAAAKAPGFAASTVEGGAKRFELAASGQVRLFGLGLENDRGAVVDNLGVVSVNIKSFEVVNAEHFRAELAHRNADLVMIMIGANEAQWLGPHDPDTKSYAQRYGKLLASVRAARPDGACLVVSPTDQAEARDGGFPSRAVMPVLVAAQREAARSQGCGFFSTYDWMGGKGSAETWYRKGLVGSDFQHLSRKGANKLSEAVYGALRAGYQAYASP